MLSRVGSRCWTMTKPIPLSGGIAFRNAVATSSPPADIPMPTIGKVPPIPSAASLPREWDAVCRLGADALLATGRRRLGVGLPESPLPLGSFLLQNSQDFVP